jgi:hypothetical protein
MNLHSPRLSETISDLAFYLLILLATFFIWLALTVPTSRDPKLLDPQVVANLAIVLFQG